LGGNPSGNSDEEWQKAHNKVIELGGLFIIGTERHESRRIDNQLRGRSGRQGDPGGSRFFVSLEDDVIQRFGGDRIKTIVDWAGFDEDTPIENKIINRSIESAQVRVEGYHFDIRKHLVDYDDVVNQQRELIYDERRKILSGADLKTNILSMVEEELQGAVAAHSENEREDGQDIAALLTEVATIIPLPLELNAETVSKLTQGQMEEKFIERAESLYEQREQEVGSEVIRELERRILLRTIDSLWIEHLTTMEEKRHEAGWQSLRQVKSVDAYKNMGYEQFQILLDTIRHDVAHTIFHVSFVKKEAPKKFETPMVKAATVGGTAGTKQAKRRVAGKKIGRNDPCPCGSGKKYKHCCGK
ncbi:SEC-C metal-binding domain-containing protein, partial [Chloroflexota bacterium]